MGWKSFIEDVKETYEELSEDVKNAIDDLGEKINDIDVEEFVNSDTFKKISSLVIGGKYILGYSLLNYVIKQATNNSSTSNGWTLNGNTLKAIGEQIDNLLLINQSNSTVINIDASLAVNNLILVGNTLSNAITAGSGSSSLWGGGEGNNTLTGGAASDQFWYLGGGTDLVTNFSTGRSATSDIAVLIGSLVNVSRNGGTVSINFADGNSINLQTNSASSDDVIQYSADGENTFGAKIADALATNLTYYSGANYFQLSNSGTLNVTDAENNSVWLDGSQGQSFANIANIDATTSTGNNSLAGDANSNTITGGAGTTNLWGGAGNVADNLIGGSGENIFWFGKGDGADKITNAKSNDTVKLYDINLSDIISADVTNKNISVVTSGGANLSINFTDNLSSKFNLADGSIWQFDNSAKNWQAV